MEQKKLLFLIIIVVILLFLLKSCQTDSLKDSDKDGFTDKEETDAGTDINNALDYPGPPTPISPPLIPVQNST